MKVQPMTLKFSVSTFVGRTLDNCESLLWGPKVRWISESWRIGYVCKTWELTNANLKMCENHLNNPKLHSCSHFSRSSYLLKCARPPPVSSKTVDQVDKQLLYSVLRIILRSIQISPLNKTIWRARKGREQETRTIKAIVTQTPPSKTFFR